MKLHKKARIAIICIVIAMILVVSCLILAETTTRDFIEVKEPLLSSSNKACAGYQVFLKQNPLFGQERILPDNNSIIAEYVDYIKASFNYDYTADKPADISGNYEIIGVLEAYTGKDKDMVSIWQKKYEYVPKTAFERNGADSFSINKEIRINFSEYNEFVELIAEDTKIDAPARLSVVMNVNIKAATENGVIEESMNPSLVIPLKNKYFTIGGDRSQDKPAVLETVKREPRPVNRNYLHLLIIADAVLINILIFIFLFTKIKEIDEHQKTLIKIFKKHGGRLVALNDKITESYDHMYEVFSIDDLVRIADEIGKPIVYQYNKDKNEIQRFYVLNGTEVYYLDIKTLDSPDKTEKLLKNASNINKSSAMAIR
ncbi:MAG: DUF5305 domain-containing protein [Clostridiaceae bacterium]|nr:DUF5305 domain-containing protein [Clostridiaceae bacterium]